MGFLTPNASGERDVISTFALQQLAQMRTTVVGLTDEQANSAPTASTLTLTALLRHAGGVAVYWSALAAAAPGEAAPREDLPNPPIAELVDPPMALADTLDLFDRCVEATRENIAAVTDLGVLVPVPEAPWYPADLTHWEARWCLAHICTEIARHVGHADIIRETIDGRGAFELNDLADREA